MSRYDPHQGQDLQADSESGYVQQDDPDSGSGESSSAAWFHATIFNSGAPSFGNSSYDNGYSDAIDVGVSPTQFYSSGQQPPQEQESADETIFDSSLALSFPDTEFYCPNPFEIPREPQNFSGHEPADQQTVLPGVATAANCGMYDNGALNMEPQHTLYQEQTISPGVPSFRTVYHGDLDWAPPLPPNSPSQLGASHAGVAMMQPDPWSMVNPRSGPQDPFGQQTDVAPFWDHNSNQSWSVIEGQDFLQSVNSTDILSSQTSEAGPGDSAGIEDSFLTIKPSGNDTPCCGGEDANDNVALLHSPHFVIRVSSHDQGTSHDGDRDLHSDGTRGLFQHDSNRLAPDSRSASAYAPSSPGSIESPISVTSPSAPARLYCNECPAEFTGVYRRGNLGRHVRHKHRLDEAVECVCEICHRVFRRQDSRLKHYRRHHPELQRTPPKPRGRPGQLQIPEAESPADENDFLLRGIQGGSSGP